MLAPFSHPLLGLNSEGTEARTRLPGEHHRSRALRLPVYSRFREKALRTGAEIYQVAAEEGTIVIKASLSCGN